MTDISESGIEAARKAAGEAWETGDDKIRAAIQAYLPFHPPAREEGLREAAKIARDNEAASDGFFGTDAFKAGCRSTARAIASQIEALIPTKPEAMDKLPCDVHLPPATILRKGVGISTLMQALRAREALREQS